MMTDLVWMKKNLMPEKYFISFFRVQLACEYPSDLLITQPISGYFLRNNFPSSFPKQFKELYSFTPHLTNFKRTSPKKSCLKHVQGLFKTLGQLSSFLMVSPLLLTLPIVN